ncbi:MAG TPA: hypothetical protein VMW45_05050 [Dehalococcoidia bacterium]|nr:hypothetical protein [Dehalococcoidia bacterium]
MKFGIASILLLVGILVLIPCLPAMAQTSGNITITMSGAKEFSINLTPANWSFGTVSPNTENKTDLTQFNLTVDPTSSCAVNTYISGEDAVWADDPKAYNWTLSSNENNDIRKYALWFKLKDTESYIPITKTQTQFYSSTLGPGDSKQFGLKLLTPQPDFTKGGTDYFSVGAATMQTHITISAVVA